ncbi:unnamed protein product [Echinostoma caproni]|uniref:Importin N-terminal domain-containing protein n=1 Tax=Echinostoma caproni TaxID=27848 RepID=A0A183A2X4_9TREM|nr:unnamed protein product [Echinostoma caproni]
MSWWYPQRIQYMNLLKAISKQSISTEELPDVINKTIQTIDNLVGRSSYTAQCQLFYEFLPSKVNDHHGLRGHLITLCKDNLHSCWVSVQKSGIEELIEVERLMGESDPQLPLQRSVLACFCEMTFVYPNTSSSDALVDQSSWLLAAANMALYIFLRCDALMGEDMESAVANDVLKSLLRTSDGLPKFASKFLIPLRNDLDTECNRLQANAYALSNDIQKAGDHEQKKQFEASLMANDATLLRLRLLQVTVQRLSDCYDKFHIAQ